MGIDRVGGKRAHQDLQRLMGLQAGRRGAGLMMRYGTLVWSGRGVEGGTGRGPEVGACGGQGEWETGAREEEEGRGLGERGLGRGAKEMRFFIIAANEQNESLTQAWGSRISVVCLCSLRVCLCDVRSREF